jgi:hypothetical protein
MQCWWKFRIETDFRIKFVVTLTTVATIYSQNVSDVDCQTQGRLKLMIELYIPKYVSEICHKFQCTVVAVEISDRKDLNTLYKFRNLISVNRKCGNYLICKNVFD